jgi:hypothetical protein
VGAPPYVAQWESPERIADILAGRMSARDDPRWAASGAADRDSYAWWSWRCCGMACLRAILLARGGQAPGTVTLAEEMLTAGGYVRRPDGGLDGLIYAPFVTWLERRWQLPARVEVGLDSRDVAALVANGSWVVASVHPGIRHPTSTPPERGGHLVLVHGLATTPDGRAAVTLHNPSGDRADRRAGAVVALDDFGRFFARRGVVVPEAATFG